MNKFFLFLSLFSLCIGTIVHAQQKPPVAATVDRNKIVIGEPFDLILDARFPDLSSVYFFEFDSLPHFEVLKKSKIDTTSLGNEMLLSQRITLTSWDSGRWQLPSFSLAQNQYKTKPITIDVGFSSPFDPKQEYHDVKEIIEVQQPEKTTWYWYAIGALLLLVLFILLFPGKKKETPKPPPPVDAYQQAIHGLEKLKKDYSSKEVKLFYIELVDVFRNYLHQRKGIQSFSKTTDDLAAQIKGLNLPAGLYNDLVQTLQLSDAVKFARFTPGAEENDESFNVIRKSIDTIEKA